MKRALWVLQNFGVWYGFVYVVDTTSNKVRKLFKKDVKYWDPNFLDLSEEARQQQETMERLHVAMLDNKGRPRIVHIFDTEN